MQESKRFSARTVEKSTTARAEVTTKQTSINKTAPNRSLACRILLRAVLGLSTLYFCILAGAVGGLSLATAVYSSGTPAQAAHQPKTSPQTEKKPPKASQAASSGYILADDQLSNLRLADVTKPVYDRHTVTERTQEHLPVETPTVPPFTGKKVAYLTFDDGPDRVNTPKILDILEAQGVPATFYVLGYRAEQNPEVLKRIFREGHAIGNHSYDHEYDNLYSSPDNFLRQILRTDETIHNILGVRPLIVRAPGGTFGNFTQEYWATMKSHGYTVHDWNVCTNDATKENPNATQQIKYVDRQTNEILKDNAANILMHCIESKEETVKALPEIISLLKEKGYVFGVITPMTPQPY